MRKRHDAFSDVRQAPCGLFDPHDSVFGLDLFQVLNHVFQPSRPPGRERWSAAGLVASRCHYVVQCTRGVIPNMPEYADLCRFSLAFYSRQDAGDGDHPAIPFALGFELTSFD
jgi:hypothetical protein